MKFMRFDVINFLIEKFNYESYLEIGLQYGVAWEKINCQYKVGVEPIHPHEDPRIKKMYSDEFFNQNSEKFDIIFIDGDHNYGQVIKDIRNAKSCLNSGGSIVLHDCRPLDENHGTNPFLNGTVWKAVCEIRSESGWSVCTLDDDHGVGVLREGDMTPIQVSPNISYSDFDSLKSEILNLKNEDEFKMFFKSCTTN
jgi:hypothetical protein